MEAARVATASGHETDERSWRDLFGINRPGRHADRDALSHTWAFMYCRAQAQGGSPVSSFDILLAEARQRGY